MEIPLLHMSILDLVQSAGYIGLFIIVFAESSIFFNFFLPGSSLLFAAGALASQGFFNIFILILVLGVSAILGDSFGYWIGARMGPAIFKREESRFFSKKHLKLTEDFYERHGSKAVIIGRFVPVVRSFIPMLAGVGSMKYRTFLTYNVFGGILWSVGVTSIGFILGNQIQDIESFILPMVAVVIVISFLPIVFEVLRKKPLS